LSSRYTQDHVGPALARNLPGARAGAKVKEGHAVEMLIKDLNNATFSTSHGDTLTKGFFSKGYEVLLKTCIGRYVKEACFV